MGVKKALYLILGVVFFSQLPAYAFQGGQGSFSWEDIEESYSIRQFKVQDGLPINSIKYISHHTDGFLYLATYDGLVRFDGVRFITFNTFNTPEIKSNRIEWIGEGENGYLWFTDTEDRLYGYKDGLIKQINLQGKKALKITQLDNGKMLVAAEDQFFIQKQGTDFDVMDELPVQKKILNSYLFDKNELYVFYDDGLYVWKEGVLSKMLTSDELLISANSIFNLTKTQEGVIWALTNQSELLRITNNETQKLYRYKGSDFQFWDLLDTESRLIISTRIGYLQLDKDSGEISDYKIGIKQQNYFEDKAWKVFDEGLVTKIGNSIFIDSKELLQARANISFLMVDREGSIWVATNGDGIYQIKRKKMITIGNDKVQGLRNIYSMWEGIDGIWATSFNQGLHQIRENSYQFWTQSNSGLTEKFFRSVFENNQGEVWAGNSDLWKFENKRWIKIDNDTFNTRIDAIFEDSKKRFWVGTSSGLFKKEGNSFSPFKDVDGESIESVASIKERDTGEIVVATLGQGLARFGDDKKLHFITTDNGLNSNLIRDFHFTSDDTLWVVTEDKGLNRVIYDDNGDLSQVHSITVNDGLVDNSLHRFIEDGLGYIWINSNKGIMRIQEQNLNDYADGNSAYLWVSVFTEEHGLMNIEGNGGSINAGMITSDGKLLFPNQAGIVYTRPEWHLDSKFEKITNPIFEEIHFSESTINLLSQQQVTLPKGDRSVQVKFTLPYLSSSNGLNLEYYIEGVYDEWQQVGEERTAIFTYLPAGEHHLQLRGGFNDGLGFRTSTLIISVPPYFYETEWFYLISFIGLVGAFIGGFQFLLARSKNREKKLNELVNKRTNELKSALNEVEHLSEARSQFFTNFTHELRTPLSLILNPLDEMLDESKHITSTNRDSLEMMRRNARKLKELVNKLLDVSKLNSDEISFKYQKIELVSASIKILSQFDQEFKRKEIKFSFDTDLSNPTIILDITALEHILVNLMSNAIKFTPQQGIISVSIGENEGYVLLTVKDSGTGIPKNEIDRVFDPYFQGDSTVSKAGGTGIGLALVKGLVEHMGGEISVDSTIGEGTEFRLKFVPGDDHVTKRDSLIDSTEEHLELDIGETTEQLSDVVLPKSEQIDDALPKVLLVEDNPDFREYFAQVIASVYTVETAENGEEGLEKLATFKPEIIVSDIMMPKMDGYEMMKNIRAEENFKTIPFIFLSAKDSAEDVEKGLNLGADIYLSKPIENNILLTQIKVLLRRERLLKETSNILVEARQQALVKEVKEIIHRHLGNPDLSVDLIAESLSTSSATLYRNWKKVSELSINKTIAKMRFDEALKLIREEELNITEASYVVGFREAAYFSRAFKKEFGLSPQEYLKKH
ncbi:MAG: response regulator [Balneola sp.]